MKIFNFELESKLDLHLNVKFDGESDGDGPDSQKPYLDPLNGPYRHWNKRIARQKDTDNPVSFLAGGTLCVLRLII